MAIAKTKTWLSLDRAAELMGWNLWHFNNIKCACDPMPTCQKWQRPQYEQFARAIRAAELKIANYVNYYLAPDYTNEKIKTTNNFRREINSRLNVVDKNKSVKTRWKKVRDVGVKATSIIELGATVTYTDDDGDGCPELATITVPTNLQVPDITNIDEIKVYFPEQGCNELYEIRPTCVTIDVNLRLATITFHTSQALNPVYWRREFLNEGEVIDCQDATKFVETLDVYRVYHCEYPNGYLLNEFSTCSCGGVGCGFCKQDCCLTIRDNERGHIAYNQASWQTHYPCDSVSSGDAAELITDLTQIEDFGYIVDCDWFKLKANPVDSGLLATIEALIPNKIIRLFVDGYLYPPPADPEPPLPPYTQEQIEAIRVRIQTTANFYRGAIVDFTQDGFYYDMSLIPAKLVPCVSNSEELKGLPQWAQWDEILTATLQVFDVLEPDYCLGCYVNSNSCMQLDADTVELNYLSGDDLVNWEDAIIALAACLTPIRTCACCDDEKLGYWQVELAQLGQNNSQLISDKILNNPFGTKRGEVYAWRKIHEYNLVAMP